MDEGKRTLTFLERVSREVRVHVVSASHVGIITDQIALLAERLRECFVSSSDP